MPAVHIKTNVAYTEEQKTKVLKEITRVMVDVALPGHPQYERH